MASYNEKGDLESVENQVHQQEGILLCNSYLIILKMILKFLYLLLWNLSSVTKVTCGDYFLTTILFFFFFFFFFFLKKNFFFFFFFFFFFATSFDRQ